MAGIGVAITITVTDVPCVLLGNNSGPVAECGCPIWVEAPPPPELPFPSTEENRKGLREFLVDYYRSSTFNTCQHQALPLMHGLPLEFHISSAGRTHEVFAPASVPIHW